MFDSEDLLPDEAGAELDRFEEIENTEGQDGDQEMNLENQEQNEGDEERKEIKAKKVIKRPRINLNVERLKGPKGLTTLERYFEKVKFKGKGYEEGDLNVLLKTYEYWCHRMFPKFPFQDSIEKIETLGSKKPLMTYLKRIRMGILDEEPAILNVDNENNLNNDCGNGEQHTQQQQSIADDIPVQLSEEQLERIRINRENAMRLREERMQKIRERAEHSLGESSRLENSQHISQNNDRDEIHLPASQTTSIEPHQESEMDF